MRIALDAMGSDQFPRPDVEGAVMAAREYGEEVLLIGDEKLVRPALESFAPEKLPITLIHAPEMLTMQEKGLALALKAKQKEPKTSMAVGVDLVKQGRADAFVTMGNTGAAASVAFFRLGMLPGIERPALAPVFPTRKGFCVVLDIGINPDLQPKNLMEFAVMGAVYAEAVRGVKRPRVALLSNGEEAGKGNFLVREATPLFAESGLNFTGNAEPKEVYAGNVDVLVTDGFTGNVFLKSSEAVAKLIVDTMKEKILGGSLPVKLGGLLVKPALADIKKMLDPSEEGAAPLLGVDGLVFIGHGRSDSLAVKNAIRVAAGAARSGMQDLIRKEISRLASGTPGAS
ncbi:MAG: phosphate acyltransferase PlsX [Anaerolineales bacterium]|nr:phosphate acyltransferase PlsX [Anaerolineales bacterium]